MNITLKMLSCGHVERTIVGDGLVHEYSLWVENGAYMLRHTVKCYENLVHNQLYVERVKDTTIKAIRALYKESVAWAGMCKLYSYEYNDRRYNLFASEPRHAERMIHKYTGVPANMCHNLIS